MIVFVRSLHFMIHWCPPSIFAFTVSAGQLAGISSMLYFSSNPFWIVRYVATRMYSFSSDPSFALSGHPWMQNSGIFDMLHHQLEFACFLAVVYLWQGVH